MSGVSLPHKKKGSSIEKLKRRSDKADSDVLQVNFKAVNEGFVPETASIDNWKHLTAQ